jgi:hypothetical protein
MSTDHRIRLRRPWQCQPTAVGLRWLRRFNWPTRLEPGAQVWLVCERFAAGPLRATLNGRPLGTLAAGAPGRLEITAALASRNELWLEIASSPGADANCVDQPPGEVCLEIGRVVQ